MRTSYVLTLAMCGVFSAGLAACGGGSGGGGSSSGGSSGGGTTNVAPVITSSGSVSVPENGTAAYTTTATDGNGNALAYTLTGTDAAKFTLNASTGALTFNTAPNFEWPADANHDNTYDVTVNVSDGTAVTTKAVAVTVTDRAGRLSTRRVGQGFSEPLFVLGRGDGSNRVLVVQKGGLVRVLDPVTGTIDATPFLDVRSIVTTDGERGLLGLVLAPDFATSGLVYAYLTAAGGEIQIRKFTATASGVSGTGDVILTIPHAANNNHNGGWLGFDTNGMLIIGVGDGGGAGDTAGNAQNPNVLLGKMLRIDPRTDAYPADANRDYAIPAGNPYAATGGAPEIWHIGLRNPFRNAFDRDTNTLYIADVGQGAWEEIDMVRPTDPGLNFGWNILEATHTYNGGTLTGLTPPIAEYSHGSGALQGGSITGGYVYRGPVTSLRGQYVFGDFVNKRIWSIPVASFTFGTTLANTVFVDRTAAFAPAAGAIGMITSFGEDDMKNLYVVDYDGEIFLVDEVDEGA